jgi:Cysteine-rich CPXCG
MPLLQLEELYVDLGGGEDQSYVEDCSVCCHPRVVHVQPGDEPGEVAVARAKLSLPRASTIFWFDAPPWTFCRSIAFVLGGAAVCDASVLVVLNARAFHRAMAFAGPNAVPTCRTLSFAERRTLRAYVRRAIGFGTGARRIGHHTAGHLSAVTRRSPGAGIVFGAARSTQVTPRRGQAKNHDCPHEQEA